MARDWVRLPSYSSKEEAEKYLPDGWQVFQIEQLYEQLPVGKRFEQKTSLPVGSVPVIDQSAAGIVGWHNEEPGVLASPENPVVTFANHTCEMRLMEESFSVIQNVFPLIGRNGVCQTRFLYYLTKGRVWLEEYKGHFPDFRRKWVCCPPDKEQEQLVKVFGDLDDKINLNRRINQTLEAMAKAIFKSWFVDFDPVKAKIAAKQEGRDPLRAAMSAISGKPDAELDTLPPEQYAQLAATAALFPDEMEESELGEIPKGWKANQINQFGDVICGKTPSKTNPEYFGGGIPFIKIPDMHNSVYVVSPSERLSASGVASQAKKTIPPGSICVSCIATVGKVVITHELSQTNQQINSIVPRLPQYTTYLYFQMKEKEKEFHDLASGGSATLNMNTSTFSKVGVLNPEFEVLEKFSALVAPLFSEILARQKQSALLSETRDTLLPKLLSGELSVTEAAAEVGA